MLALPETLEKKKACLECMTTQQFVYDKCTLVEKFNKDELQKTYQYTVSERYNPPDYGGGFGPPANAGQESRITGEPIWTKDCYPQLANGFGINSSYPCQSIDCSDCIRNNPDQNHNIPTNNVEH